LFNQITNESDIKDALITRSSLPLTTEENETNEASLSLLIKPDAQQEKK